MKTKSKTKEKTLKSKVRTLNVKVIPCKSDVVCTLVDTDNPDRYYTIHKNYCISLGLETFEEYNITATVTKNGKFTNLNNITVHGQYERTKKVHSILKRS